MARLGGQAGHGCLTALSFSPFLGVQITSCLMAPPFLLGPLGMCPLWAYTSWPVLTSPCGGHSHTPTRPVLLPASCWHVSSPRASPVDPCGWGTASGSSSPVNACGQPLGTCCQLHWARVLRRGSLGACSAHAVLWVRCYDASCQGAYWQRLSAVPSSHHTHHYPLRLLWVRCSWFPSCHMRHSQLSSPCGTHSPCLLSFPSAGRVLVFCWG